MMQTGFFIYSQSLQDAGSIYIYILLVLIFAGTLNLVRKQLTKVFAKAWQDLEAMNIGSRLIICPGWRISIWLLTVTCTFVFQFCIGWGLTEHRMPGLRKYIPLAACVLRSMPWYCASFLEGPYSWRMTSRCWTAFYSPKVSNSCGRTEDSVFVEKANVLHRTVFSLAESLSWFLAQWSFEKK